MVHRCATCRAIGKCEPPLGLFLCKCEPPLGLQIHWGSSYVLKCVSNCQCCCRCLDCQRWGDKCHMVWELGGMSWERCSDVGGGWRKGRTEGGMAMVLISIRHVWLHRRFQVVDSSSSDTFAWAWKPDTVLNCRLTVWSTIMQSGVRGQMFPPWGDLQPSCALHRI